MKPKLARLLHLAPRGIAVFLLCFWLVVVLVAGSGHYLVMGLMIWSILLLTFLTSLKNQLVGGSIFIILGLSFFLVTLYKNLSLSYFLDAAPLLAIGSLFIADQKYNRPEGG